MSDWNCEQVEGWIDLYTAGECDAPTRTAVGRHLKTCPSCTESHREARQLAGLLDQRFQESERLQRLWSRLEAERKRERRPVRLVVWRAAAAAAVLVTLGLSGWLGVGVPTSPGGLEVAAVLKPPPSRFDAPAPPGPESMELGPGAFASKAVDQAAPDEEDRAIPEYPLELDGKTPAEFRRDVRAAPPADRPPPPAVDLVLKVRNTGRETLALRFNDEGTELTMDLQGPGVLDVPADAAPPLAGLGVKRIPPGETYCVTISQLAFDSAGAVHYLYWTEPGEYRLTVTLRAAVQSDASGVREVTTTSGPRKVRVKARP